MTASVIDHDRRCRADRRDGDAAIARVGCATSRC